MLRVFLPIDGANPPVEAFDLVLSPAQFGPAVNVATAGEAADRSGTLVVVYSGGDLGALEREADRIVASGAGAPPELDFVAEAALPERYRDFARIVVVDDGDSSFAAARAMLAAASGAETWRLQRGTLRHIDRVTDAAVQSDALAQLIADSREVSFQSRVQPGSS